MQRYKYIGLLIFLISILILQKTNSFLEELPLFGYSIYLDAGHGGVDPGAISGNIYEENITLKISNKLKISLENKGAIVFMTREYDYDLSSPKAKLRKRSDLSKRVKLINESNCDLYLSVHLNASSNPSWKGAQVFYNDVNEKNSKFASIMQKSLKKYLATKRTIKEIKDLYMYKNIKIPGLLLEVGFITNTNERYNMKREFYQDKISKSITEGVINYIKQKKD